MRAAFRVIKNSVALMTGQTYAMVINLVAVGIIARYLPLPVFGDYGFVLALCMIFSVVTDMGTNQIMIREIARNKDRAREFYSAGLIIKLFLSLLTMVLIVVVARVASNRPGIINAAYIGAIAVTLNMIGDVPESVFRAYERMELNACLRGIQQTTYLIAILAVVFLDLKLKGIFGALTLGYFAKVAVGFFIVFRKFFPLGLVWNWLLLKWLFREAFPIGLNRIFRQTTFRIDTILLKLFVTRQAIGVFHGIYRVVLTASFIPRNVTDSLFPMMSRNSELNKESVIAIFNKAFKFLLILVLPLILVVSLMADQFVRVILGSNFVDAAPLMRLLLLVWGFSFFSILCNKTLYALNRQRHVTIAVGLCLAVNILLDLILIPRFGYMGAGVATLSAEVTMFLVSLTLVCRFLGKIWLGRVVARPLISAAIAGGIGLYWAQFGDLFAILFGGVVYVVMLVLLRVFQVGELDTIKAVFSKLGDRFKKKLLAKPS
jgi:O-antigen/teichoic acid export membrane protein